MALTSRNRRLKVFQAQFGFYDTVVAAPSQAAALRAWGIHQNLFADGQAKITDDPQGVDAALAHPETPLRRAVGSQDPFSLEPAGLPKVPDAPSGSGARVKRKAKAEAHPPKPPADRSDLDVAERSLLDLEENRKREESRLKGRQQALEDEITSAQSTYVAARKEAAARVARARQAFDDAGGA